MSKFGVFHIFDEDDFEDAIIRQELICIFDTEEQANNFKIKYENPHVYDPVHIKRLECGKLEVREFPTTYNEKDFWWLHDSEEE